MKRKFRYTGPDTGTRGEYGIRLESGETRSEDPEAIWVWDPDFGWSVWASVEAGLRSGEWKEVE